MYIVYKTINTINNEFYIGVHKTSDLNDGYLGSGIRLTRSVQKYGKENFQKEILFIFENKELAFKKEIDLLKESLDNPSCINIAKGGQGGDLFKGKKHNKESIEKIRKASKERTYKKTKEQIEREKSIRKAKNNGKHFSLETIEKLREKARQRKLSEETKRKISKSLKSRS